ncbi:glutamate receptor ionotropic, NMDA 1 [Exaiptasia diaphana]|uniref:Ionotropic glutamate receptor C-terminal domain-containing protein n=1 Tax=Exaiptasia diaphana TaxID=2652724 RepID=A0A913YV68_EXADI|nr:glutamate receptor ionotropic, NMDA 1 [Exaiptasia diaphana]KXJ28915.1 Glutamate receptor ionotropic, NMDA 1 [Exaiptasia diaphana]
MCRSKKTQNHPKLTLNEPRLCRLIVYVVLASILFTVSSTIKVGLIIDDDGSTALTSHFSKTITGFNYRYSIHPSIEIKDVILKWDTRRPPHYNYDSVQSSIIQANISIVLSFLQSNTDDIFCSLMANSNVIVINLRSESQTSNDLQLSLNPSHELLAAATKNTIMEFDKGRFTCITTFTKKYDPFWIHFFQYVRNDNRTHTFPKCLVLENEGDVTKLRALLAAIRASGIRIIVVHAESKYVSSILNISQQLSLQTDIGKDIRWVLTDLSSTSDLLSIPSGTIGIAKAFNQSRNESQGLVDGMDQILIDDAIAVIGRAVDRLVQGNVAVLQEMSGLQGLTASSKRKLYSEILNDSFTGQSGLIRFSPVGQRVSYDFIVTKLVQQTDHSRHWTPLGRATTILSKNIGTQSFTAFTTADLPKPRHLKIVTIIHSPFTMVKQALYSNILGTSCDSQYSVLCKRYRNTIPTHRMMHGYHSNEPYELLCCYGIMIDILLMIQKETGFTYELYIVRDGKFGSFDEQTQKVNGMVGDVYRGEADMALATLTITRHRYNYVTFTAPYMGTSLAFLVKRQPITKYPFPESLQDMRLLKPFKTELWLACGAAFLIVSTAAYLIEKLTKYRHTTSDYFLPFEFITYVFGNIFHVPLTRIHAKSFAVPCLMVWVNCGALVLISSYTANLLVSLIVVDEVTIVKGIDDTRLVDPSKDFKFGTIKDSSTEDFFRNSDVPRLKKIYENMKDYSVHNFSDGINKVKNGDLSTFIGESDALQYIIDDDTDCELKIDGKQVDLAGLAFALRKESEWEQEITQAIYKLNSRDEIAKAFEKWTIRSCKKGENTVQPYRFGFDEFGGFLFNTALCCAGCFVILGLEIFLYHRIARKRQKFSIQMSESVSNLVSTVSTQAINAHDNNQFNIEQSNGHVKGNETKNGTFTNHIDSA